MSEQAERQSGEQTSEESANHDEVRAHHDSRYVPAAITSSADRQRQRIANVASDHREFCSGMAPAAQEQQRAKATEQGGGGFWDAIEPHFHDGNSVGERAIEDIDVA